MKRRQLESLLTALVPTLRHFIERKIDTAQTQLRAMIADLPKPKDGEPGKDGKSVTLDDVTPLIRNVVGECVPKAADVAPLVLAGIELPKVPTADEVAKLMPVPEVPAVPTAEEIAKLVPVPAVPTAEDVVKLVQIPAVPTLDEIVERVMIKLPSAKEIADLVPVPTVELKESPAVPTIEQIIEQITPKIPSLKSIADEVRASITVPSAAEIAEQAAKLVELPEIEIPQLPELPNVPSTKEIVDELLKQLPAPEKGDKGDPGQSVDVSAIEQMIERHIESRVAKWALEWERRADDRLQKYLAAIEKPKDGVDGLGFERADKPTKSFAFDLPIVIYRGVWKDGDDYLRGDSVTWDGCTWIAKQGNCACRPGQSDMWQLAVKKGRDGRDSSPEGPKDPPRVRVAPRKPNSKQE